ncbi:hypothetical protein O6H91_Y197300 [Diphasiastrum complanatum]|nr:hypothetical protein O6H91_Y197300 [Diphasiastrum complanatum]
MSEVKTIVLRVGMHCEGCARKVKKSLCSLSGLEELKVEYKAQKVTVKGAIDQKQVLEKLSHIGKSGEILQVIVEPVKPKEEKEKKEAPKAAQAPPPQVVPKTLFSCQSAEFRVITAKSKF